MRAVPEGEGSMSMAWEATFKVTGTTAAELEAVAREEADAFFGGEVYELHVGIASPAVTTTGGGVPRWTAEVEARTPRYPFPSAMG